jgi:hypothetical protein
MEWEQSVPAKERIEELLAAGYRKSKLAILSFKQSQKSSTL